MTIFKQLFLTPVSRGFHHFVHCFTVCLYAFDTVQDCSVINNNNNNKHKNGRAISLHQPNAIKDKNVFRKYFILPVTVWLILAADYVRFYFSFKYSSDERSPLPYGKNPAYFTHRMYAPAFWAQGDMLVLTVSSGFLMLGLALSLRKNWLNSRYYMAIVGGGGDDEEDMNMLVINGRVWFAENGKKILHFRAACRRYLHLLSVPSVAVGYLFFAYNFWNAPFNDVEHYLKLFIYLPVFSWYCIFTVAVMFFHFYVLTKYVTFRQKHLLGLQSKLVKGIKSISAGKVSNKSSSNLPQNSTNYQAALSLAFHQHYSAFTSIQSHYAYQCAEIRALNDFWSLLLTILFSVEIVTFCYLLYSCLFFRQSADQFIYLSFFLGELGVFLFVVILWASKVDLNNDLAYLRNLHIGVLFGLQGARGRFSARQVVNIEKLATNRNFSLACFRLVNGYRVDSTAFQMASFVIGTFFLMICRQNRRQALS